MVPTFHDLRRFATQASPGSTAQAEGDPFLAARRPLPIAGAPTRVFAVDLPAGRGRIDALAADEFILVLAGELSLTPSDGVTRRFARDASVVLTKGTGFAWSAPHDATLIVLAYAEGGGEGSLHAIDGLAKLAPSKPPLAELLIGDTPTCRSHAAYLSSDGAFVCGVWDSSPYRRKPMRYRHCELMHLLQGAVTVADETGRQATFQAGDVFFVEAGAECSWNSREHVAKVYAIHRPACFSPMRKPSDPSRR